MISRAPWFSSARILSTSRYLERNLLALAVLSGAPMGEVATLLGIAPSTLIQQLGDTDAALLGQTLARSQSGQWVVV